MSERPHRHGFDIDDVLYPSASAMLARYEELHGVQVDHAQWYNTTDLTIWGVDDANERSHRINSISNDPDFIESFRPVEGAQEALEAHRSRGDVLAAITGRPSGEHAPTDLGPMTRYMLQRDFPGIFPEESVFFTSHFAPDAAHRITKLSLARQLELNRFTEDFLEHANPMAAAAIRVYLFDSQWNQEGAHESLVRVKGWSEHVKATEIDDEQRAA